MYPLSKAISWSTLTHKPLPLVYTAQKRSPDLSCALHRLSLAKESAGPTGQTYAEFHAVPRSQNYLPKWSQPNSRACAGPLWAGPLGSSWAMGVGRKLGLSPRVSVILWGPLIVL